MLRYT